MTINDSHTYFDQQGVYQSTSHLEKSKPELAYQFSPHFHPYVGELVHELIEGGVSGLQAIDTQYHTLIKLKDAVAIEEGLSIQKDEILILAEGTVVEYQTRKVRLSLDKLVNCQSGLTEKLPESGEVEIKLFERTVADLPPEQIKLKKLKSREVTSG